MNVIILATSQVNYFLFQRHRRVTRIESYWIMRFKECKKVNQWILMQLKQICPEKKKTRWPHSNSSLSWCLLPVSRYRRGVLVVKWRGKLIRYRKPNYRLRVRLGRGWRRIQKRGRRLVIRYGRRVRRIRLFRGKVSIYGKRGWRIIRRRMGRRTRRRRRIIRRRRRRRRRRKRRRRRYKRRRRRRRRIRRRRVRRCVIRVRRGRRWYPVYKKRRYLRIRFGKISRPIR